jgi:hypothetical protein
LPSFNILKQVMYMKKYFLLSMFLCWEIFLRAQYTFTDDMPQAGLGPVAHPSAPVWHSVLLDVDSEGRLIYTPDADGFVLPDFSYAGYKNGDEPIPDVPVVRIIEPVSGDNTSHIQAAINAVGALTPDANGIRGALLLKKGLYPVKGPIYLNYAGVVLRGEGNEGNPATSTVIYDTYKDPTSAAGRKVLIAGNRTNDGWDSGKNNETNIIDEVVPVGARTVHIAKNTAYSEGDLVCIYHPCTEAWLQAVNYGETFIPGGQPEGAWTTSSAPIYYHRYVTAVNHSGSITEITLDAPVFYTLRKSLSQCKIYRFNRTALQNIGVENLRIDIANEGIPDDYHAWNALSFENMENGWAKDVVTLHFGQSGFITARSTRLTIERCFALDPVGTVTGGMGYNFNTYQRSQLILFKECYARNGRHNYISNGTSVTSGCVVYRCKSEGSRAVSEGHRLWTQGMLFDNHEDFNPITTSTVTGVLGFYNRMDMGSGHGWAMAHGVLWNCNAETNRNSAGARQNAPSNARSVIYCEKPPTAQNYAIGCFTHNASDIRAYRYPTGYIEGANSAGLYPASLYEAQVLARNRDVVLAILQQPQSSALCRGADVQLSVVVEAPDPNAVTCQWNKDGNPISGAVGRNLLISGASLADAGQYTVTVACNAATVESAPARISVVEPLPDELQFIDFPASFQTQQVYLVTVGDPATGAYPDVTACQWDYTGSGLTLSRRTQNPVEISVEQQATDGILKVRVYHPCGLKQAERQVVIAPQQTTGYGDTAAEQPVVYPNPATNQICIRNAQYAERLDIIDLAGKLLYSRRCNGESEHIVPLDGYRDGIYILRLKTPSGEQSFKFVKKQ